MKIISWNGVMINAIEPAPFEGIAPRRVLAVVAKKEII